MRWEGSHANASCCGAEVVHKVDCNILIPSLVRDGRHLRHSEKNQYQSQVVGSTERQVSEGNVIEMMHKEWLTHSKNLEVQAA